MKIDVAWVPDEVSRSVGVATRGVVIDVIRATTSIATALDAGARAVLPAESVEEARRVAADREALLCGERSGTPPAGFDLGNSPHEYTSERIHDRHLVFTTTNGTRTMRAVLDSGVRRLWLGCFRNLAAVAQALLGESVLIACSGRQGRVSMDDAWCAGHLVHRLVEADPSCVLTDGASAAQRLAEGRGRPSADALAGTAAGAALVRIGLERDLAVCARFDDLVVAPVWAGGAFVKGGGEEGI